MKVKIYWEWAEAQELLDKVNNSLEDLWLSDFMEVEVTMDEELKNSLSKADFFYLKNIFIL